MSFLGFFILVFVGFFFIVTLTVIGLWQSYKTEGMLGALVLMWVIISLFLLAIYLGKKNLTAEKESSAVFEKNIVSLVFRD